MKTPSIKRLEEAFDLTREQAKLVKQLGSAVGNADELRSLIESHCPDTARYADSCYGDPYRVYMWRVTLVLHAIDRILGTHGVEQLRSADSCCAPPYEYCNTGDTYDTTLIYKRATDTLSIGCLGDIERKIRG